MKNQLLPILPGTPQEKLATLRKEGPQSKDTQLLYYRLRDLLLKEKNISAEEIEPLLKNTDSQGKNFLHYAIENNDVPCKDRCKIVLDSSLEEAIKKRNIKEVEKYIPSCILTDRTKDDKDIVTLAVEAGDCNILT